MLLRRIYHGWGKWSFGRLSLVLEARFWKDEILRWIGMQFWNPIILLQHFFVYELLLPCRRFEVTCNILLKRLWVQIFSGDPCATRYGMYHRNSIRLFRRGLNFWQGNLRRLEVWVLTDPQPIAMNNCRLLLTRPLRVLVFQIISIAVFIETFLLADTFYLNVFNRLFLKIIGAHVALLLNTFLQHNFLLGHFDRILVYALLIITGKCTRCRF